MSSTTGFDIHPLKLYLTYRCVARTWPTTLEVKVPLDEICATCTGSRLLVGPTYKHKHTQAI